MNDIRRPSQPIKPFILNHNIPKWHENNNTTIDSVLSKIGGNSGNMLAISSLAHFMELGSINGLANMFLPGALSQLAADEINEKYTHLLINLQDHIRAGVSGAFWDELVLFLKKINIPIIVVGVGANALGQSAQKLKNNLSPELIRFFKYVGDVGRSIGIRGHYTAETLHGLGISNYAIVGCPSWFEAGPARIIPYPAFDPQKKIAALGLFSHREILKAHFIFQDEIVFLHSFYEAELPRKEIGPLITCRHPLYTETVLTSVLSGRWSFFSDIREWRQFLAEGFSFAAGTRVHGSIVALNSGLPALCTSGDMRAQEMCELFKIPHQPGLCCADSPLEALYDLANPQAANDAYPLLYARFVEWLTELGLYQGFHADDSALGWISDRAEPLPLWQGTSRLCNALDLSGVDPDKRRILGSLGRVWTETKSKAARKLFGRRP